VSFQYILGSITPSWSTSGERRSPADKIRLSFLREGLECGTVTLSF